VTWLDSAPPRTDDPADRRIEQALRELGRDHQSAPGWQDRVLDEAIGHDPVRPVLDTIALWVVVAIIPSSALAVLWLALRGGP
jgi:hypothetical protein